MQSERILGIVAALSTLVACGDDGGGLVCGDGTADVDGVCQTIDVVPAGDSPAHRRLCDTTFGPIPSGSLHVNAAYADGESDGTLEKPFTGIQAAIDVATSGQSIGIAAGTYTGDLNIGSSLALEGRCANDVLVDGTVTVQDANDVAIRGLTIRNGSPGILATNVQATAAEFGLEIRYVLMTANSGAGLEINASSVRAQDSEFAQTQAISGGDVRQLGSGIFANNGSVIDIRTSIIIMNGFMAVDVADAVGQPIPAASPTGVSKATPTSPSSGIIIMNGIVGNAGGGIRVREDIDEQLVPVIGVSEVAIVGNDFSTTIGRAIEVNSAPVRIDGNTMAGSTTGLTAILLDGATGAIANNSITAFPKGGIELDTSVNVSISGNEILDNAEVGILARDCDNVVIDQNRIERTTTSSSATASGHGIYISAELPATTGRHTMSSNTIVDNAGVGVAIDNLYYGTDTDASAFSIFDSEISRNGFAGININDSPAGDMFGNVLDANKGFGLRCEQDAGILDDNNRVFFDGNVVTNTAEIAEGGDGVLVVDCHVSVDSNELNNNFRYGAYFTVGLTSGGCDDNTLTGNGLTDLVEASGGGMSISGNTAGSQSGVGDGHNQTPIEEPIL